MGSGQIKVGIVGASGYAGGELVRLLSRHPQARIVELQARGRSSEPIAATHPHLARTGLALDDALPSDVEVVFLALPHGAAAELVPGLLDRGLTVIDLGPDFRLEGPGRLPALVRLRAPAARLAGEGGLRPA